MSEAERIPDAIEKKIVLRAPRSRVWRAISDAKQFGIWFGVDFGGQTFEAGKVMKGHIVPTKVDPEVAKMQEPHKGKSFEWSVDKIEPETRISFRWHPFAIEEGVDYSQEPTTLIVFELEDVVDVGGKAATKLTIRESGFSKIPLKRRAEAFTSNEGGWEHQTKLLEKFLDGSYAAS